MFQLNLLLHIALPCELQIKFILQSCRQRDFPVCTSISTHTSCRLSLAFIWCAYTQNAPRLKITYNMHLMCVTNKRCNYQATSEYGCNSNWRESDSIFFLNGMHASMFCDHKCDSAEESDWHRDRDSCAIAIPHYSNRSMRLHVCMRSAYALLFICSQCYMLSAKTSQNQKDDLTVFFFY